ncbi:hypothetical protein BA190_29720 [Labrys sp. WJW]|nr:hypothetical protein BA190_29720 [Labrys sp. WJW]
MTVLRPVQFECRNAEDGATFVIAGLDPAIQTTFRCDKADRLDARGEPGHDKGQCFQLADLDGGARKDMKSGFGHNTLGSIV